MDKKWKIEIVSRLGFGCGGLSGTYNAPLSHEEGCSVIKEAFSKGITFFDTSDLYGDDHDNEILVGKALKQLPRDKVQLATKFGILRLEGFNFAIKGTPEYVRKCCEASLKRLDVDYIDLYYQHRVDTSVPIENTCRDTSSAQLLHGLLEEVGHDELEQVVEAAHVAVPLKRSSRARRAPGWFNDYLLHGLLEEVGHDELEQVVEAAHVAVPLKRSSRARRAPGWFNDYVVNHTWSYHVDTLRRAHAVHPITALQMEYSLWTREIEEDIIPVCRELGIGIVAYSPLGRGFFGGKATVESLPTESILSMHPRYSGDNLEKNKLIYARFKALAEKHKCAPPQLALSWVLHQGEDIVPIPGTTKIKNLENNIGSLEVKLTQDDLKEICDTVPIEEVSGGREYDVFDAYRYKLANTPKK
ncbi:hypothetical protein PTKIN_Ptkin09bG0057000 [Pterospermum kingtungense]